MTCTLYLMTNICEMQRLCTLWQIFVRCRAGGKYLTVDTSHSPQWQSATTQGCPWPWRRGNAFWIKVENNGCCSFVHLCANAMLLGRIDLSLSPAPDWRANVQCPFSQPSATNLHLNASILTTSDQPCVPRTYFLNQIKSGQKKDFIKTSSWHTLRHTACEF